MADPPPDLRERIAGFITGTVAARKAPSWRRVCKSLLRNDYWGKGLGFSQHKSDAYTAYQDLMRRRREQWGVDGNALQLPFDAVEPVQA